MLWCVDPARLEQPVSVHFVPRHWNLFADLSDTKRNVTAQQRRLIRRSRANLDIFGRYVMTKGLEERLHTIHVNGCSLNRTTTKTGITGHEHSVRYRDTNVPVVGKSKLRAALRSVCTYRGESNEFIGVVNGLQPALDILAKTPAFLPGFSWSSSASELYFETGHGRLPSYSCLFAMVSWSCVDKQVKKQCLAKCYFGAIMLRGCWWRKTEKGAVAGRGELLAGSWPETGHDGSKQLSHDQDLSTSGPHASHLYVILCAPVLLPNIRRKHISTRKCERVPRTGKSWHEHSCNIWWDTFTYPNMGHVRTLAGNLKTFHDG
jgi:hypothetical protein